LWQCKRLASFSWPRNLENEEAMSSGAKADFDATVGLEHALAKGKLPLKGVVPIFDRKWCPEEEPQITRNILLYFSKLSLVF
jgi:hypothetical protein